MVNPQKERGYVGIANEIWDEIIRRDFTKRQKDILQFILRISYGCGRKIAHVPFLKDFSLCGIGQTNIKNELIYLDQCEVIYWDREENNFGFNKNYNDWQVSPVREWNPDRFKEILHINLMAAKQERGVIEMITDSSNENLSNQEPIVIDLITDIQANELLNQEPSIIETITDCENGLLNQEPTIIKTITNDGHEPNNGAASESLKKGLKKENIKDLLKQYSAEYDLFFSHYPRKIRKKEAYEIWIRLMILKVDPNLLIRCSKNYDTHCRANVEAEKFILHASTFLNPDKERYMDYSEVKSEWKPDNRRDHPSNSRGKSGKPTMSVVRDNGPIEEITPERRAEMMALAQSLKDSENKPKLEGGMEDRLPFR
jgi:hypothetical protein